MRCIEDRGSVVSSSSAAFSGYCSAQGFIHFYSKTCLESQIWLVKSKKKINSINDRSLHQLPALGCNAIDQFQPGLQTGESFTTGCSPSPVRLFRANQSKNSVFCVTSI